MLELLQKFKQYIQYIEDHYNNVQNAWLELQEKCQGKGFIFLDNKEMFDKIDANIKLHDISKLSKDEFTQYRKKFFPTELEKQRIDLYNQYKSNGELDKIAKEDYTIVQNAQDVEGHFQSAWLHHWRNNPHHWENWTDIPENENNQFLKTVFLIENICDWMAMGYAKGDTAKSYYESRKADLPFPLWAKILMNRIFNEIYPK